MLTTCFWFGLYRPLFFLWLGSFVLSPLSGQRVDCMSGARSAFLIALVLCECCHCLPELCACAARVLSRLELNWYLNQIDLFIMSQGCTPPYSPCAFFCGDFRTKVIEQFWLQRSRRSRGRIQGGFGPRSQGAQVSQGDLGRREIQFSLS